MAEGGGGQGPEILIAGKNTPIEDIKKRAEATSVDPNAPLQKETPPTTEPPKQKAEEPKEKRGISAAGALLVEEGFETVRELLRAGRDKRESRRAERAAGRRSQTPPEQTQPELHEEAAKGKAPEEKTGKIESKFREPRDFYKILADKRKLLHGPPDEQKENELILETARLVRSAKDANIFHYLKDEMAMIQTNNDYKVAREKILNINIGNHELQAKGFGADWDPRYEGMLAEYRDVALLNMDLAMLRAKGEGESDEAKHLEREIHLRGWGGSPIQGLETMARKYLEIDTQKPKEQPQTPSVTPTGMEEYFRRSLEFQEQQIELMKKGYKGFIKAESQRAHVNPEQYDQSLPPWYEELSEEEQAILRTRLHVNYLAAIKRDTAMESLDSLLQIKGLRLERKALAHMWSDMPGFREAFATMVYDIFDPTKDHFVISGTPGDKPTGGYAVVGSEELLNTYKSKLIESLTQYLDKNRKYWQGRYGGWTLEQKFRVDIKDLAQAAVSAADNLLFAGGAYDSGDELRKIQPGDANVYSEQVRALYMPGVKGKAKWLVEAGADKRQDNVELGVGEEDFGGPLGTWLRDNARHNRMGYRDRIKNDQIRFFPRRLFYSLFDHTYFESKQPKFFPDKDDKPKWRKYVPSFAHALTAAEKKTVLKTGTAPGETVWDYKEGAGAIDINGLDSHELLGGYADTRSVPVTIFKHITGGGRDDIATRDKINHALMKGRKDPLLNPILRDEDLMTAIFIKMVSPAGLIQGTPYMVLNIPESTYDSEVYNATLDSRFFEGVDPGFRKRLLKRLNARDMRMGGLRNLAYIALPGIVDSSLFSVRDSIRKEAEKNLRKSR